MFNLNYIGMSKKMKIILGILLILLSPLVAYSATFLYDFIKGNEGREFITFMYGFLFTVALLALGIYYIIDVYIKEA